MPIFSFGCNSAEGFVLVAMRFCILRELHNIHYPFEEFLYRQARIIILSEFLFFLLFDWLGDISLMDHDILNQLMARYAQKSFILVLFLFKKFRRNRCNDLFFDCMLAILAGDKPELVTLSVSHAQLWKIYRL